MASSGTPCMPGCPPSHAAVFSHFHSRLFCGERPPCRCRRAETFSLRWFSISFAAASRLVAVARECCCHCRDAVRQLAHSPSFSANRETAARETPACCNLLITSLTRSRFVQPT